MLSFLGQQTTAKKIYSEDQISNTYTGTEEISTKKYTHFQALLISLLQHILRLQDVDYLYFLLFVIQAVSLTLILVRKLRSNICFKNGTISYLAKKCISKGINNLLSMLGIDLNRTDSDGKAPLHLYAEKNNVSFGMLLLYCGADVNVKTTGRYPEKSPLYISAENGHKDFVQLLLKWKANVNELNGNEKKSALRVSIERGFVEIMDILLDARAGVNLADGRGETALHYAVRHGRSKLDEMLYEKDTIIRNASAFGETTDLADWTALYTAAVNDSKRLIQLLLDKGAAINSIDNFGKTALHCVSQDGSNEIVDFLLEAGASADIIDKSGQTALHCAVGFVRNPVTALTLLKGTSVFDIGDRYGNTALHYSCRGDLKEVVEALLEAGADVDRRGQIERTPLHYSVMFKQIETMRLLIQRGANLDITDDNGQTALDMAITNSNHEAVAVLRQYGAKSSAEIKKKNASAVEDCSTFTEVKSTTETTAPYLNTTPTASTNTRDANDDSTPSTDTAPSMDSIQTASTTTPDASDDTNPNSHTAPSIDTSPTVCTTTTPVDNVATTTNPDITLATSTTITDTSTNTDLQKSSFENKSYKKHNTTQSKQQMLSGNHQSFLETSMEKLNQSDTDHDHSVGFGLENAYKQDIMDTQEASSVFDSIKNKENINSNSTIQHTMGESCNENVDETKQTRIKQTDANFPFLDFLDVILGFLKSELIKLFENQSTGSMGNVNITWNVNYNPTFINNHYGDLNIQKSKYVAFDSKLNLFLGKSKSIV